MTIGIIGTGWGARVQIPAFRSAGLPVVALAGRDADKTARIAHDLGVPFSTGDWAAVLARDDVQLVSVVTPPPLHAEIAMAALRAGKHVLCEKPTALDASQARAMLAAAHAQPDCLALVDHELRFLPGLKLARQLIAEGALGEVRRTVTLDSGVGRADPNRPWNWWSDAAQGGGVLGAMGSHAIDSLRYLLQAEVASISATLSTFIKERPGTGGVRPVTADDSFTLQLAFTNGTRSAVDGSAVARLGEPSSLTIFGSEATLRWTGGRLYRAAPGQGLEDITPPHVYGPLPGLSGDYPHASVYLAHALRAYLDGDAQALAPAATFADGLRVQEVLDAARRSSVEGCRAAPGSDGM